MTPAELADHYRELIDSGELPPGTRMPATVILAVKHSVPRAHAKKALVLLRESGHVTAKPGNGHYVRALGAGLGEIRRAVTDNQSLSPASRRLLLDVIDLIEESEAHRGRPG